MIIVPRNLPRWYDCSMSDVHRRVLLVEDEVLVALDTQEILTDAGYKVVGPVTDVASAMVAVANGRLDAAVLDVNLRGAYVWPIADALQERGIPFIFVTGFGTGAGLDVPENLRGTPRLGKPIAERDLLRALASCFGP